MSDSDRQTFTGYGFTPSIEAPTTAVRDNGEWRTLAWSRPLTTDERRQIAEWDWEGDCPIDPMVDSGWRLASVEGMRDD